MNACFSPDVSIELRECNKSSAGDSGHMSGINHASLTCVCCNIPVWHTCT